jgi:hypothetical protein
MRRKNRPVVDPVDCLQYAPRKDRLVSNTPSSRELARIQPSALIFVVLVLILGALLLASGGIDPRASERARFTATPVDVFNVANYTTWKSPDGAIQFEHPDTWSVQPDTGVRGGYMVAPSQAQYGYIRVWTTSTAGVGGQDTLPITAPADILKQAFATAQPPPTFHPAQAAGLSGAGLHQSQFPTNTATGQQMLLDQEVWLLSLDPSHVIVIQGVSQSSDWPKMQRVFDHLVNTLKIDAPTAVRALEAQNATAVATGAATGAATTAATQAAPTSAATQAAPETPAATAVSM